MAGLGLMNALQSYRQGVQWHQQQQEQEREQRQQKLMEDADKAAASVLEQSRGEWAMNGAQGQWAPNDSTMLKAAEARGIAFAKGGDWGNYLKNEAAVQRQRIRLRAGALQRYEQDGDPVALLQAVYPTIFDGQDIVSVEKVGGMPALDSIGREATPTKIRFKLSGGTEGEVTPDDLVRRVKMTLADPETMAQQEIQANLLRTRAQIEAEKQAEIARARGEEVRASERVRQDGRRGLEQQRQEGRLELASTRLGGQLQLADVNNASREKIAADRNATTLTATDRREAGANARAEARAEGGGGKGGGSGGAPGLQSTKVDADGYIVGVFRNGDTKRLTSADGKPIRSGEWSKRVDALAAKLRDAPGNFSKPPAELRKLAEDTLAGSAVQPAARPPLGAFDGTRQPAAPGLGSVPASRPPLSQFMVK